MADVDPSHDLSNLIEASAFAVDLFDRIPDVVYFVKDEKARYVVVNQTLVQRCGLRTKDELLGRTALEVFPAPLGRRYLEQDLRVCTTGRARLGRFELHLYSNHTQGWCLTDKHPIRSPDGRVVGIAGISRDLHMPGSDTDLRDLSETLKLMQKRYADPLRVEDLAARSGMSVYRFSRRIREIFQLTPSQLITKIRIDAASELLRTTDQRIAEIAQRCGYFDQSAFTRQFRTVCGLTPTQYREI